MYSNWGFARIQGIGWGWAGVIWIYSIVFYIPLDILKFLIRYLLSGKAWDSLLQNKVTYPSFWSWGISCEICSKGIFSPISDHSFYGAPIIQTAFTTKKDYGREEREARWAAAQRSLHGLHPPETSELFSDKSNYGELSEIAEQAKRRAEIAR